MGPVWLPIVMLACEAALEVSYPRLLPPVQAGEEPRYERWRVTARDKTALAVHEWRRRAAKEGETVLVFVHGLGLHGRPYGVVASGFTQEGITLIVPDLRGHGHSAGPRGELADAHVLRADLDAVIDAARARHPQSPIVLLGNSMGGLIAADYARQYPKKLAGLILLAPAFRVHASRLKPPMKLTNSLQLADALLDGLIRIDAPEHLKACTREPGFSEAYRADPLATHAVKPQYLLRVSLMGLDWPAAAKELRLPLFVGVAGKDQIIDNAGAKAVFDGAATPGEHKTYRRWDAAYHTLCWDPLTPDVVKELSAWARERGR